MRIALLSRDAKTREQLGAAARAERAEICGVFAEAETAIARLRDVPPDLLVVEVGAIEGGATRVTKRVLAALRCPVLLVARSRDATSGEVARALEAGATDVAMLPADVEASRDACLHALAAKLRMMQRLARVGDTPERAVAPARCSALIAIGASTGGPNALAAVLKQLPKPCPVPVLVTLHIDKVFVADLLQWLSSTTGMPACVAASGELPRPGAVQIAASDDHLVMRSGGRLDYTTDPIETPYRPSVDVLFDSLAQHCRVPGVAVLLTGMGRDGAAGLLRLRGSGWRTIAQDEASSMVYGMPKAAAELGAAEQILALDRIGAAIGASLGPR